MALTIQLAFCDTHPRVMFVFGGKSDPETVIAEPTVPTEGEAEIVGEAADAPAGLSMTSEQTNIAVTDNETSTTRLYRLKLSLGLWSWRFHGHLIRR